MESVKAIIGRSASHLSLLDKLSRVARTDAEILITGPSGVGKELYAAFAHHQSRRSHKPFVTVNCSNLSPELLENELFGHAHGAYTGAHAAGDGIVTSAEGGTLFFDEVDTLNLVSQAKLLRFVQHKEYRRLGETRIRKANVRFIAASNCNLTDRLRNGYFREDLFFRLRVVPLEVPRLAARPEDVAPLFAHFAAKYAGEYGVEQITLSEGALAMLEAYHWPGNVRELENCVRYLTCLQPSGPVQPKDLPSCWIDSGLTEAREMIDEPLKPAKERLVTEFERHYLVGALERARGNVAKAARASGKHRRAFFALMRKHGITAADYRVARAGATVEPEPAGVKDR
jgi:two-component system, NtrC family, response regulator GlrR